MNTIVILLGIIAAVSAEKEAPYPPSGWKPEGPQLTYPPPTPPREYGPASTPAPTEPPTQPPQEPPATYIPSEQTSEAPNGQNGYQRYQNQRFTSQASAQLNQGTGQFFIITPQGQLQHIPIAFPQATNKDAENVEPQSDNRRETVGRFVQQQPASSQNTQQRATNNQRVNTNRGQQSNSAELVSITPDGRLEKGQASQRQTSSARVSSGAPSQGQTQFVAFIPAVPLERVQAAATAQSAAQNGQYHVIYPNGKLQRVRYMNVLGADNRLMANVQYQEVDPLQGPLYTFGSPLVRVL